MRSETVGLPTLMSHVLDGTRRLGRRRKPVALPAFLLFGWIALLAGAALAQTQTPTQQSVPAATLPMRVHQIVDRQHGGLVLGTLTVPQTWRVTSEVQWNYGDVSLPVRAFARAEAPDGSAWVEFFPVELFYWLEPVRSNVAVGARNLGMIHAPNIEARQAILQFLIRPHRAREPGLRVAEPSPVDAARMLGAFHQPPSPGEAWVYRLDYVRQGVPVEEDVFGMLGAGNRIPYTGPQGTWYESHRPLMFGHALGATQGRLADAYPLLTFIATSLTIDPIWIAHRQQVEQHLSQQFNQMIARGYAQIQAAAQLSKTISANNDAMLASMQTQRQVQAQRDAARRAEANRAARSSTDAFGEYIRGTETMKDPYWGTSQQSYNQRYHWTDGQGNYRSSNDANFNPNVGAGGGPNWQPMERER